MAMSHSEHTQGETRHLLSASIGSFGNGEDSSDDEDYGDTPDWHDMTYTGNERAQTIRTICKLRAGKMDIFDLYLYGATIGEILLAERHANKKELLDRLTHQYPLIDKYRSLDMLTIALVTRAFRYFLERKAGQMRAADPVHGPIEVKRMLYSELLKERERILAELSAQRLANLEEEGSSILSCLFCWKM